MAVAPAVDVVSVVEGQEGLPVVVDGTLSQPPEVVGQVPEADGQVVAAAVDLVVDKFGFSYETILDRVHSDNFFRKNFWKIAAYNRALKFRAFDELKLDFQFSIVTRQLLDERAPVPVLYNKPANFNVVDKFWVQL